MGEINKKLTSQEIKDLIHSPIPYETILFEGKEVKIRMLNNVSDQARENLNNTYRRLHKLGLA